MSELIPAVRSDNRSHSTAVHSSGPGSVECTPQQVHDKEENNSC